MGKSLAEELQEQRAAREAEDSAMLRRFTRAILAGLIMQKELPVTQAGRIEYSVKHSVQLADALLAELDRTEAQED